MKEKQSSLHVTVIRTSSEQHFLKKEVSTEGHYNILGLDSW